MLTGSIIEYAKAQAARHRKQAKAEQQGGWHKTKVARERAVLRENASAAACDQIVKGFQEPTVQANVVFVEYGYQIDVLIDGKPAFTLCRDFGGNYEIEEMAKYLADRLHGLMETFERKFKEND